MTSESIESVQICARCDRALAREANKNISDIERIELFLETVKVYEAISQYLVIPSEHKVSFPPQLNDSADLPMRVIHISILRKYVYNDDDAVHLKHVAKSIDALSEKVVNSNSVFDVVVENLKILHKKDPDMGISFVINDIQDDRSANKVVEDYLYGLILHGDSTRVKRITKFGDISLPFAAAQWLPGVQALVNFVKEKAIDVLSGNQQLH